MAELADALDSGSSGRKAVQVQVLLPAPKPQGRKFLGLTYYLLPIHSYLKNVLGVLESNK